MESTVILDKRIKLNKKNEKQRTKIVDLIILEEITKDIARVHNFIELKVAWWEKTNYNSRVQSFVYRYLWDLYCLTKVKGIKNDQYYGYNIDHESKGTFLLGLIVGAPDNRDVNPNVANKFGDYLYSALNEYCNKNIDRLQLGFNASSV